jgi:CDP-diacylglycerol---glycerol-3-phosphate 3-phosphatidyltransferase
VSPDRPESASGAAKPPIRERLTPKPDPVGHPASGSRLWNIPNGLTMARLLLVIPFAVLLFGYGDESGARLAAGIIFVLASITDYLDGALARKYGLVTTFGKIADPIADKALTGVALIGLSYLGELPWWVTGVILFREIAVTVLRFWVIRHGVIAASRGGKAKTATQIVAIVLYLIPFTGFMATFRVWVMGAALVLAVVTGIDYLVRALRLRKSNTSADTSAATHTS